MKEDLINQFVLWKPIKIVSVIFYAAILILWPISSFWATIVLFALICFWSRIPCMISMFTKDLEMIDFFTLILALHVGGVFAGIFGGSLMLFTRIFGPREWLPFTLRNTVGIIMGAITSPITYSVTGSAMLSMYGFTVVRYLTLVVMTAIFWPEELGLEISLCFSGGVTAYITNTFLIAAFSEPLARVMENGVQFDITLFLFTTVVIVMFYGISKIADMLEKHRAKKMVAEGKPPVKNPVWALDADAAPRSMFTRCA